MCVTFKAARAKSLNSTREYCKLKGLTMRKLTKALLGATMALPIAVSTGGCSSFGSCKPKTMSSGNPCTARKAPCNPCMSKKY